MSTQTTLVISATVLALATGCKPGDSGSKEEPPQDQQVADNNNNNQGPKAEGDEDLSVEVLVPMGLLDPSQVATIIKKMPKALAPFTAEEEAPVRDAGQALGSATAKGKHPAYLLKNTDDFYTASGTGWTDAFNDELQVTMEAASTGSEVLERLGSFQKLMTQAFGVGGYFQGMDLKLAAPSGKGSRLFKLPKAYADTDLIKADYANVSYDAAAAFPYAIDFLEAGVEGGGFERSTRVEFKKADAAGKISVHLIESHVDPAWPDYRLVNDMLYTTGDQSVQSTMWWDLLPGHPPATDIGRYQDKFITNISYTDTLATVTGAYRWFSDEPADPLLSRWDNTETGDIHVFHAVAKLDGSFQGVQEMGNVFAGEIATLGYKYGPSLFTAGSGHEHYTPRWKHLVEQIRNPTFNTDCATQGIKFRDAFTAATLTAPAPLSTAPANLCLDQAAFTAADLETLVQSMCLANDFPVMPIMTGADELVSDLCDEYFHIAIMRNAQNYQYYPRSADGTDPERLLFPFYKDAATELILKPAYDETYASLETLLKADTTWSLDASALAASADVVFDVPRKTAAEVAAAEAVESLKAP